MPWAPICSLPWRCPAEWGSMAIRMGTAWTGRLPRRTARMWPAPALLPPLQRLAQHQRDTVPVGIGGRAAYLNAALEHDQRALHSHPQSAHRLFLPVEIDPQHLKVVIGRRFQQILEKYFLGAASGAPVGMNGNQNGLPLLEQPVKHGLVERRAYCVCGSDGADRKTKKIPEA